MLLMVGIIGIIRVVWNGRLAAGRFQSAGIYCPITQVHLIDSFLLKRLIRAGSSLRLTPLVSQLVLVLLVGPLLLLLGNCGFVQSFMNWPVEKATSSCSGKVFLVFHDLT